MKGKPIEPGCLAMIVGGKRRVENLGRAVRVLYRPAPYEGLPGSTTKGKVKPWLQDTWFVQALPDQPPLATTVVGVQTRAVLRVEWLRTVGIREKNLIRIDDNDENLDRVVEQSKPVIKTKPIEEIF